MSLLKTQMECRIQDCEGEKKRARRHRSFYSPGIHHEEWGLLLRQYTWRNRLGKTRNLSLSRKVQGASHQWQLLITCRHTARNYDSSSMINVEWLKPEKLWMTAQLELPLPASQRQLRTRTHSLTQILGSQRSYGVRISSAE